MDRWSEENIIRLEIAVSRCGRNWVFIATDPRFELTNFSADALRMKYNSMAETEEWNFSDDSSEEEQQMVDYLDVGSYINGPIDYDDLIDDPDYIPAVYEDAVYEDQDWWEWWDNEDPDYIPFVTELPAAVEGKYSLRRRMDNPLKTAVYVAPPNINELRLPQIPMKWNEDYYKEFARAMSIHGHNWSKMTTDSTIGLPSNLKGPNLKDKWRAMDVDHTMWSSDDDFDLEHFDDEFSGEHNNGYAHYLLHPHPSLNEVYDEVEDPIQLGFTSLTAPDFKYQWGSNFEVGSSSKPPRKTPRKTPEEP